MNITIAITSIICATILIIVCIVALVQYKLKNNEALKDIKSELEYLKKKLKLTIDGLRSMVKTLKLS